MKILNEKTISLIISKSKPDKCGYLMKKSSEKKKNFKRRYFVLVGNFLVYYEKKPLSSNEMEPYGFVILEGHFVDLVNDPKLDYVFQISFGTSANKSFKNYILAAESEGDLKDWMQSLVTAGSDYFQIKENELSCQIKAIREVLACQLDVDKVSKLMSDYRSTDGLLHDFCDPYLIKLLSMTFEDMHSAGNSSSINDD